MAANEDRLAEALAGAWRAHRQIEVEPALAPHTAAEAYRIQDSVFAARYPGSAARAWKVGAAGPGVEPARAPIGLVLDSPAKVERTQFHMYGIEVEIAFRLCRDLPLREAAWSEAEIADAIGQALVTIELCDTRLAGWESASAMTKLADFQLNGALIAGSGTEAWQQIDFSAQPAELWINGIMQIERIGVHPLGTPVRLMPWAAAHCARSTGGLRAGDLVTTGSWTGMRFAAAGDTVLARFPGIGEASLSIL